MTENEKSLLITAALSVAVMLLLIVVSKNFVDRDIQLVLMLLAGMLTAAILSTISHSVIIKYSTQESNVSFNERYNRKIMDNIIDAEFREMGGASNSIAERMDWELEPGSLLSQDPTLALAKLRIDLETELRRIYMYYQPSPEVKMLPISKMVAYLQRFGIIGSDIVSTLNNVIPVCNDAIHGNKVNSELAATVLDIGSDITRVLRSYPKQERKNKSDVVS